VAQAQPFDPPEDGDQLEPVDEPPPPPPPPAPVSEAEEDRMDPAEAFEPADADSSSHRPEGMTLGIGLGYDLPSDLQVPDVTSVRLRLGSGLTIEPLFEFSRASATFEQGGVSATATATEMSVAALVRVPFRVHDRVDFTLNGGAGFARTTANPDGPDNDTTTTSLFLIWGIGLDYWLSPHWGLSMTALNPMVSYTKQVENDPAGDQTTSGSAFGLVFDPNVLFMLHMYL